MSALDIDLEDAEGQIQPARLRWQGSHERQPRRERAHRESRHTITRLEQFGRIPKRGEEEAVRLPKSIPDRLARRVEPGRPEKVP
jgi:hypothetical protein